jgi:hypothetical protein
MVSAIHGWRWTMLPDSVPAYRRTVLPSGFERILPRNRSEASLQEKFKQ